jgi:hypothetical protein
MKHIRLMAPFLVFALLVLGCKDKPKNPVEEYGGALINSYERSKAAQGAANLEALKKSIAAYRASNGSYPADLGEAASFSGIQIDPGLYDYDPGTGQVALRQPAGR